MLRFKLHGFGWNPAVKCPSPEAQDTCHLLTGDSLYSTELYLLAFSTEKLLFTFILVSILWGDTLVLQKYPVPPQTLTHYCQGTAPLMRQQTGRLQVDIAPWGLKGSQEKVSSFNLLDGSATSPHPHYGFVFAGITLPLVTLLRRVVIIYNLWAPHLVTQGP